MRIQKRVFAEPFGNKNEGIINESVFSAQPLETEHLLGMNEVFTSQPGFQCTS